MTANLPGRATHRLKQAKEGVFVMYCGRVGKGLLWTAVPERLNCIACKRVIHSFARKGGET